MKYVLEGMLCWSWQENIDRLVSTLDKTLYSARL